MEGLCASESQENLDVEQCLKEEIGEKASQTAAHDGEGTMMWHKIIVVVIVRLMTIVM